MSKENNILSCLKENQNIIVVCKGIGHTKAMIDFHKEISKNFKKICMLTINEPSSNLIQKFQKANMDYSNYFFIDCISAKETRVEDSKQFLYVSSPSALTELALAMGKIREEVDLMILDNISSLLIYNNPVVMQKFLHSIMTKIRQTNTKALYFILEEDKKLVDVLSLFADAVIDEDLSK